jgi:hypothetical protein
MDRTALEDLIELNRNVQGALTLMEKLSQYPELNHEDFVIYQSYFQEYLADTNMLVLEALQDFEQRTMLRANRERLAFEKKIRDPDDCYFDVRNREAELRAQGKPSRIGVLRGMRRISTEDILSGPLDDDDDESGPNEESEHDEVESSTDKGGSDADHER